MAKGSKALMRCNVAVVGHYKDYKYDKVSGWIANLGGHATNRVDEHTTHVAASEKAWTRKDAPILKVLELNKNEDQRIQIVSFDWLQDSADNRTKKREGPYLWEKLDASIAKKDAAQKRAEKAKDPKSHVGMMAEVFNESTNQYVDEREMKRLDKQIEQENRVRKQIEEEEKQEREEQRRKQADVFARGAKKARNDLFSESHHICQDDTGFKYDITLTKVDTLHNRNERYALTLQIYESNATPQTYATNCQFAGTGHLVANNVIAAIGATYPTAFHVFRKTFKEKTGVHWDDRVSFAIERAKGQKKDRGLRTGSEAGSRLGVPVSEARVSNSVPTAQDFASMVFEYHPPRFGAKGRLPKEKLDELAPPQEVDRAGDERVEYWMSGANGAGPENAIDVGSNDREQFTTSVDGVEYNHFEALMNGDMDRVHNGHGGLLDAPSRSIYDNELTDLLEDTYPFNQTHLEFPAEDFNIHGYLPEHHNDEIMGQTDTTQQDQSFTHTDTNQAEDPTSFALASTVPGSFEQGTQEEAGETQVAERARGELTEFMHLPPTADTNGLLLTGLDLGSSILGKRKTSAPQADAEPDNHEQKRHKTVVVDDGDVAFAGEANNNTDDDSYLLAAPQQGREEGEQTPRVLLQEDQDVGVDEGINVGDEEHGAETQNA